VPAGLVEVVVDAHDDVQGAVVLDRRGDDHLAHAALEVRRELSGVRNAPVHSRTTVDAELVPGHVAGRAWPL
jgi:hypothetical protein